MFTLERSGLDTIQLNLGYKCNQACSHCHVEAGPSRTELMTKQTKSRQGTGLMATTTDIGSTQR